MPCTAKAVPLHSSRNSKKSDVMFGEFSPTSLYSLNSRSIFIKMKFFLHLPVALAALVLLTQCQRTDHLIELDKGPSNTTGVPPQASTHKLADLTWLTDYNAAVQKQKAEKKFL